MYTAQLPQTFLRKKEKILRELGLDESSYYDKSPKGSVDEDIRELISEINAYDGIVTTSSCAGRISVFLEGPGKYAISQAVDDEDAETGKGARTAPGGKGGGEWLFVSHKPIISGSERKNEAIEDGASVHISDDLLSLFRLSSAKLVHKEASSSAKRYVRLSFEPLILHVMTASLRYAQPLLTAAINAGFRESGVQGLRNLDDLDACPMVAIRTAGIALESVIGYKDRDEAASATAVVDENYLRLLIDLANERFKLNTERTERFRTCLREAMDAFDAKQQIERNWEAAEDRARRKRQEGLRIQSDRRYKADAQKKKAKRDVFEDITSLNVD